MSIKFFKSKEDLISFLKKQSIYDYFVTLDTSLDTLEFPNIYSIQFDHNTTPWTLNFILIPKQEIIKYNNYMDLLWK